MPFFRSTTNDTNTPQTGGLVGHLYTRLTGRPYTTVGGHASRDFGPTPGAVIAQVFGAVPNDVAVAHGTELFIEAKRILREQAAAAQQRTGGTR